jgi:sortase A
VARSRWTRIGLPALAVLCALAAGAALAFPWLSNLYAQHEQKVLAEQLDSPAVGDASGSGAAIGRIVIPAIGLDMVVVEGTDAGALTKGPGHYPDTPMPCTAGNVAIAGHRTTFLHPFYNLNLLGPGDVVELQTRSLSCTYTVSAPPFAVLPSDTAVVANTPGSFNLTLTTCNPRGSSAQRLVVRAAMVPDSLRTVGSASTH